MNRNPTQRMQEDVRYSRANPPTNEEAARLRIDKLQEEIPRIETDLEHKEVESFSSEGDYEVWRRRAISALSWKKSELRFLERWIAGRQEERMRTEHADLFQTAAARGLAIFEEIKKAFSLSIVSENPPANAEEAKRNFERLRELEKALTAGIAEMRAYGSRGLTGQEVHDASKPLHSLAFPIFSTIKNLKEYLQDTDKEYAATMETGDPTRKIADIAIHLADEIVAAYAPTYSQESPPPDMETAKRKLARFADATTDLQRALRQVNSAWHEQEYFGGSLTIVKQPLNLVRDSLESEQKYLKAFILETEGAEKKARLDARRMEEEKRLRERVKLTELNQSIRALALCMAEEIGRVYTPIYTVGSAPANLEDAKKRQALIGEVRIKIQSALSQVTNEWTQYPLDRDCLPSVKHPIVQILHVLESEAAVVKQFIATHYDNSPSIQRIWKSVCVVALTRASMNGFQLTPEEHRVVQELLDDLAKSPS